MWEKNDPITLAVQRLSWSGLIDLTRPVEKQSPFQFDKIAVPWYYLQYAL